MRKLLILILISTVLGCTNSQSSVASGMLPVEDARSKISEGALLLDVRSPEEFSLAHIAGAVNIPHNQIMNSITALDADKDREIVIYCDSGRRADQAKDTLEEIGYKHVYNGGSIRSWIH